MNIKSIKIKNFKSIKSLQIEFNTKFNVLIGTNNVGKTTILEAMLLWKKCYDSHIQQNKKKFYAKSQNIRFNDVDFLRVSDDIDLFNQLNEKCKCIDIEIIFKDDIEEYSLGFEITKVSNINNAYFQLKYINKNEFVRFEKLSEKYSKKLNEIIAFFDTRPIASIITKEPYMYKDQVLSKISKGKGYEVLRNKIIGHAKNKDSKKRIENNIKNVIGEEFEFIEKNQTEKEYIKLMVKKEGKSVDILSQGSGFIQVAEIFSSIEYVNAELYILLIDEPDSHIHAKLQSKLLKEFKGIDKSQLFLVTHNERFLDNVMDNEIIFINKKDKENGNIQPLKDGAKNLVLNDIVGNLKEIEKIEYANKILFVEGITDKNFIESLCKKYKEILNMEEYKSYYFHVLEGIDTLSVKLQFFSQYYSKMNKQVDWIVIRDVDFVPVNKINKLIKKTKTNIRVSGEKEIVFQNGYGIESIFFSEEKRLTKLLIKYYNHKDLNEKDIEKFVIEIKNKFLNDYPNMHSELNIKLCNQFKEQKNRRDYDFNFDDYIKAVDGKLQYIMIKPFIEDFLSKIHDKIVGNSSNINKPKLTSQDIIDIYINNIENLDDMYDFHLDLLNKIFELNKSTTSNTLQSKTG